MPLRARRKELIEDYWIVDEGQCPVDCQVNIAVEALHAGDREHKPSQVARV